MAITLSKKFSVDLSGVVNSSIDSAKTVRKSERARKEAEFQRAIADGLSYEEQIKLRETQLKDEEKSTLSDVDYISELTKSISDTKKLNRFNQYRIKYSQTLGDLSSGKINEESYLSTLKNQLNNVDDPDLRLEIQTDITAAEAKVKTYKDTILDNQVKKAKYDGTSVALSDSISRVNAARASAAISGNEDEVTAYDETLSALNSQINTVRIQDSITDFQVKSSTRGVNPVDKLNYISNEIQNADPNIPIKIGDRTYTSAQQFWSLERDNFLSGNSQIFGGFFDELNNQVKDNIDVATSKFGYPTQNVLDDTMRAFSDLRTKPELTPYLGKLDATQASVMSSAVDVLAKTINDIGTNNLTFQEADSQLTNIGTKYGVNVDAYRLQLDEKLRNLARSGIIDENEAAILAPDVNVPLPKFDATKPTEPGATAPITSTTPPVPGARIVRAGDTLSGIAREAGIGLTQLLDLNPQFKANPNIIRPGQSVNLPGKTTEDTPSTSIPASTPTPTPTPTTPTPPVVPPAPTMPNAPISTPTQPVTPKPTTHTIKSGDTLSAIALKYLGDASRYKEIAELNKIADPNKIQSGVTINIPL